MKDYHINVFYSDEDGGYIADIPDLPHCNAFGETPQEALAEVLEAKTAWIEAAQAAGRIVPRPSLSATEADPVDLDLTHCSSWV